MEVFRPVAIHHSRIFSVVVNLKGPARVRDDFSSQTQREGGSVMAAPASRRPSRRMWLGPVDYLWKIQLDGVNVLKDVSIPAELHMSWCQWMREKKKKMYA